MFKLLVFFVSLSTLAQCYKIFVFFPMPAKSHGILGDGYVKHLLEAGHEVTYATPFPKNDPHPKLKIVDLSANLDGFEPDVMNLENFLKKETDFTNLVFPIMLSFATMTLSNPNLQALMRDPKQNFDLVIAEWMFSDAYCGLGPVFKAPYVISTPMEPNWMMLQLIDEMPNPSYTVDIISESSFSFFQRAKQLWTRIIGLYIKNVNIAAQDEDLYNKYFTEPAKARGVVLPQFSVARYNASMMLGNSHVSLGEAMSLPTNYKCIGGYHIEKDVKPLPEKLKKIMDESEHGVIYFSMGSNLRGSSMPESVKKALLNLFGKLKQTVLWKFEDETLVDRPKNVHILTWAPQPAILNHPKMRIFITHGGLLSTTEAVHFGVPIIGLPVFGDQFINVKRAIHKGFALKVDWSYDVAVGLEEAINEILSNPAYTDKVKELSFIYHDRVVHPGVELAHWAQHVIETRGAPLLRSPALTLVWYQRYYVDLALTVIVFLYLVLYVVKAVLRKLSGKQKVKKNKSS